ncbi:hypothetical protein [Haloarchaeobius sp. HME9146]|uniref:hypothetical protein n=1 Tax=Haloarchaeobius sp. HME9146 TaxID=2978732 RepID=UPI0021BE6BFD|nr:hypothetical protein [Haloarchaeobius sp. HME9146]MCT9096831.1 hypothetical protein [Haloarchaeobius sp. HME9146]
MSNENLNIVPAEADRVVELDPVVDPEPVPEPAPSAVPDIQEPSWRTDLAALVDSPTVGRVVLAMLLALEFLWLAWFVTPALGIVVAFGFVVSLLLVVPYVAVRIAGDSV